MPEPRYLLRFDDICPTMNWKVWDEIEAHLARHQIRPLLAVVPDNQDPKLKVNPARDDFWDRVRRWQAQGWTIAMHGYQHLYVNQNPGIMGLEPKSEFAGLSHEAQEAKLRKGLAIFAEHGVRADAWIAPSHSFDQTTVDLLVALGVPVISDGLWPWPFSDQGRITWIPAQHWDFRKCPRGIWTICYHHNAWNASQLEKFRTVLTKHGAEITDVSTVLKAFGSRKQTLMDRGAASLRWLWIRSRSRIADVYDFFTPHRSPTP